PVAASIISRPTENACAIRSSTPKAWALLRALGRPVARCPSAHASNVPECIGPCAAPTPSSLSAVPSSVVAFRTSGSADQKVGPHDPPLSWGAPPVAYGMVAVVPNLEHRARPDSYQQEPTDEHGH